MIYTEVFKLCDETKFVRYTCRVCFSPRKLWPLLIGKAIPQTTSAEIYR